MTTALDKRAVLTQLRKAREFDVVIGRFTFQLRRPTEMEVTERAIADGRSDVVMNLRFIRQCAFGWRGVLESDVLPGGSADPMPFDPDVWEAWIAVRTDLWNPLVAEMQKQLDARFAKEDAATGN